MGVLWFPAKRFDMRAQALEPRAQIRVANGEGDAHVAIAARSERDARHDRSVALRQEIARKIKRAPSGRSDIDKRVEGAFRNRRQELRVSEDIHNDVTAAPVAVAE